MKEQGKCDAELSHRQVKYLNNRLEADHGKLKRLIHPARGFKCGAMLVKINEKIVHSRYHYVPSVVCIQDLVEDVLACPTCDESTVANSELIEHSAESTEFVELEKSEPIKLPADWQWIEKKEPSTAPQCDDLVNINNASTVRKAVSRVIRCQASSHMLSYIAV